MTEDTTQAWEQELNDRIHAILTRRSSAINAEWDRLEQAIATARTNSTQEENASTNDALSITAHVERLVKERVSKTEALYESRLVQEIEKTRAEVRQMLESDFERQLAQVTAAHKEAQSQISQLQSQLTEASNAVAPITTEPSSIAPDFTAFKTAVEEIDAQRTQSETLNALLRNAAGFAPRIAFFVVKGNDAVGWKATGFQNGLNEETVRSLTVSLQTPNLLSQALTTQTAAVALNPPVSEIGKVLGSFGDFAPSGAVAVPLVVRGKAAAVLYADSANNGDDAIQLEAIETLIQVASMGIELLPVRRNLEPTTPRVTAPAPVAAPASAFTTAPVATPQIESPVATTSEPLATPASVPFDSPSLPFNANPAFAISQPLSSAPSDLATFEAVSAETSPVKEASFSPVDSEIVSKEPDAASEADAVAVSVPVSLTPTEEARATETPIREPEKPVGLSIFEKLRAGLEEKEVPNTPEAVPPLPAVAIEEKAEESVPVTPSIPPAPTNALDAPTWMRRLESPEIIGTGALSNPQTSRPLTPPPMQKPSLANWATREPEAETPVAPIPPAPVSPAPFQADTPSLKVPAEVAPSFSMPSEPPRYAAPSLSVSTAASETEVRAHNDARRFARLLISEIKLYNSAKVNEGRRNADLYDRLRDEIDRSRKVYDKRVSPTVAGKFDYFYDELVQTLAEGDPSKLGESCPGPFVVTA